MKYVYGKRMRSYRKRTGSVIASLAILANSLGVALPFLLTKSAAAATNVVVTSSNTQGWSTADTRANGQVNFVADAGSPLPSGALQLKTGAATGSPLQDKAQYMHATNTTLSNITTLAYATKQNSASFVAGLPSYQLATCLYGVVASACAASPNPGGQAFATLVYEPYVDQGNAAVQNGTWQAWNVSSGKFWSTKTEGILTASQGAFTYTLDQLKAGFPSAVVTGFGVNVGSNNPNWDTHVDGVVFNDTTYNFERDNFVVDGKIWICHANNAVNNRYNALNVPLSAVDGEGNNDHTKHTGPIAFTEVIAQGLKDQKIDWGDIIPPYDDFAGLNWTTEGQAYWAENCDGRDGGVVGGDNCTVGTGWADSVIDSTQGTRKNGTPVLAARSNPDSVLGATDGTFFSLGEDGWVEADFNGYVTDVAGNDLTIYEVTNSPYPAEAISVEVSQDGITWKLVGTGTNNGGIGGATGIDIASSGYTWVEFVRVTDTTNFALHNNEADGFDVDSIQATSIVCEEPQPVEPCSVTFSSDITNTVTEKGDANAQALSFVHSAWTADIPGATWIWGDNPVADPTNQTIQTFKKVFGWDGPITEAKIKVAADNDFELYINGDLVGSDFTGTSFGSAREFNIASFIQDGNNTIEIKVTNWQWPTVDAQTNPAGLLYSATVTGSDEDCDPPVEEEPEVLVAAVTVCKVDEEDTPLAGWTLMLLGDKVDNVAVPANTPAGIDTTSTLDSDASYVAIAEGTWNNNRTPLNLVDAEYSSDDTWTTQMDGYTGFNNNILELQINRTFDATWGAYNSAHRYAQSFTMAASGNANFRVYDGDPVPTVIDGWYGDNSGQLSVALYKGYAGITGEDGCVTFDNVPYGSYEVDEIMQDGWENVSGLDEVDVDGETEAFSVVNRTIPEIEGRISGLVFEDQDGDEIQDEGDNPLSGWKVYLLTHNSPWTIRGIMTTGEDGTYSFENLSVPGIYYVCQDVQEGWFQTLLNQAGLDGVNLSSANVGDVIGDTDNTALNDLIDKFCYKVELSEETPAVIARNFGNHLDDDEDGQVLGASTNTPSGGLGQGGQVLAANTGLTNTGTQNGGFIILAAVGLLGATLLVFRRKQQN